VWPVILLPLLAVGVIAVLYPPVWSTWDDVAILRQADELGRAALFTQYAGYLIVVHRAISLIEGPNPLLIGALGSYLAAIFVAVFVAWRVHPAAVLALVLAPAYSVYGSLSNIQWILAVYLVAMLVATPPTTKRGRMGDALGLLACGLTGPFSMLLLPLYAVRAVNPVWRWHLFVVAIAAAIQLSTLTGSGRPPVFGHDVIAIMAVRDAVPVMLVLLAALWLPLSRVIGAMYVVILIPLLGIFATIHTTAELLEGAGQRYFYLPWVVGIGMVILTLAGEATRRAAARDPLPA
jgi:hypothetical protein